MPLLKHQQLFILEVQPLDQQRLLLKLINHSFELNAVSKLLQQCLNLAVKSDAFAFEANLHVAFN
jgi:hypothetical protein